MSAFFDLIWERKFVFLGTFFVVFTLTYIVLLAFDFIPEPPANETEQVSSQEIIDILDKPTEDTQKMNTNDLESDASVHKESSAAASTSELVSEIPVTISIAKLGKEVTVLNPVSRSVADLDTALLEGVVRHPDSATLTQEGNVFILGHSSYLPQVFNKNFQAFNGIQNLEWGDLIEVRSSTNTVYEYRVEKVYRAKAQDLTVPIAGTGKMLTLATCNSFGTVDDRYIVEAKQISEHPL